MCILGGLWGTIRETRRTENPEDLQSTKKTWKFRRLTIHSGWIHHPNDAGRAREVWQPDQDQDRRWTSPAGLLMMLTLCCVLVESWKGHFIFYLPSLLYMNAQYFCAPWKLEIYIYDQCRRPFIEEKDHLAGWLTTNTEPTIINIFFNDLFKLYPNNGRSACWYWFLMAFQTVGHYFVMLGLGSVPELLCICPCLCLPWMSKNKGC